MKEPTSAVFVKTIGVANVLISPLPNLFGFMFFEYDRRAWRLMGTLTVFVLDSDGIFSTESSFSLVSVTLYK